MTARVLVVDDVDRNVRLLEAKLTAEYFEVITATSGADALARIAADMPDIVLLDVMMPEMDGFEVCEKIRAMPGCAELPVVMVTALSDVDDKVRGLEAGADDFLTKPVNDQALMSRVRSLVRLKQVTDELRLRVATGSQLGMPESAPTGDDTMVRDADILVVEESGLLGERLRDILVEDGNRVTLVHSAPDVMESIATPQSDYDVVLVCMEMVNDDPLRLCSQLRSNDASRHTPILVVVDDGDGDRLAKALDIGATDYLARPVEAHELRARVRTQVRRRRFHLRLREDYERSIAMALTDHLTGCYNRRYLDTHLGVQIRQAEDAQKELAILVADIDLFKAINDSHGHGVGDEVLKVVSERLKQGLRDFDMLARFGGEEFVAVMLDCTRSSAMSVAERLRSMVADTPVDTSIGPIDVAISLGVAHYTTGDTVATLFNRADGALYDAKTQGRNQVAEAESGDLTVRAAV